MSRIGKKIRTNLPRPWLRHIIIVQPRQCIMKLFVPCLVCHAKHLVSWWQPCRARKPVASSRRDGWQTNMRRELGAEEEVCLGKFGVCGWVRGGSGSRGVAVVVVVVVVAVLFIILAFCIFVVARVACGGEAWGRRAKRRNWTPG